MRGIITPLAVLLPYLAAITIFGKGPTYLGIGPIYWGEIILVLLFVWLLWQVLRHGIPHRLFSKLSLLILAFISQGAALTIWHFGRWGMDALRDAALWYYCVFFFIGLFLTCLPLHADRLWKWLFWVWQAAFVWNSLQALGLLPEGLSAIRTGRGVPLFSGSGSENVMHLCLGAALLVLGIRQIKNPFVTRLVTVLVVCLSLSLLLLCKARGVKVAILGGALVTGLAGYRMKGGLWSIRSVYLLVLIAVWGLALLLSTSETQKLLEMTFLDRFMDANPSAPSGTAYWRMVWWENLVGYLHDINPVFGLGFGLNLGVGNPWLERDLISEWPVRSPHNINVTVFARMGYTGILLWFSILGVGIGSLFLKVRKGGIFNRGYSLARRRELAFWLMMLAATWLNASFGVLMEGPVLGIWFWLALGFATGRSLGPDGLEPEVVTLPPKPTAHLNPIPL